MKFYAWKVKIHMKSGAVLRGQVTRLDRSVNGEVLTKMSWDGSMPFYMNLSEITAIETDRIINWRRGFRG